MTTTIDGTNVSTFGAGVTCTALNGGQLGGRRNIVYNGEMKVAQRSTSETGLGAAIGYFTLDRWRAIVGSTAGRFTMAQVADGPAGFANCLKLTTTTADTSIAAGEIFILAQHFEGQDLQQLQKGTATAKQVTVSFYVKGNANALYVCELNDSDNTRVNTQSFAVTTAWNRIELTFAADTTGALGDDNLESLSINIWLHAGSTYSGGTFASNTWAAITDANRAAVDDLTSIFDSTDRTFFITGVQMELGDTATPFEHRSYGEELALCQRYYQQLGGTSITALSACAYFTTTIAFAKLTFNPMRANPTLAVDSAGDVLVDVNASSLTASGVSFTNISTSSARIDITTSSTTQGFAGYARVSANKYVTVSSEL
jgi:hypothetical protein